MCYLEGQPVGEYCTCCQKCRDYLSVCAPVVSHGYVIGECDFDFCAYCSYYAVCEELWDKGVKSYEVDEL